LPPLSMTPAIQVASFTAGGAPWLANISTNFRKNLKWPWCYFHIFRGLVEDDSWKKTWSKKSCDTVPLNRNIYSAGLFFAHGGMDLNGQAKNLILSWVLMR
jgi:hypothetical protein